MLQVWGAAEVFSTNGFKTAGIREDFKNGEGKKKTTFSVLLRFHGIKVQVGGQE